MHYYTTTNAARETAKLLSSRETVPVNLECQRIITPRENENVPPTTTTTTIKSS